MEYLPLGDLRKQHKESVTTIEETVMLLQQALAALQYLHAAHRDLKPENILLQSRSPLHIKLADFGLAKEKEFLQTLCGTPRYVPPEMWQADGYTAAVNIWSLGVITFEFGYGLPDYPEDPGSQRNKKLLKERGAEHQNWYSDLVRIVDDWDCEGLIELLSTGMLKMNPQERLSAAECLIKASKLQGTMPSVPHTTDGGTSAHKPPAIADPPVSEHQRTGHRHSLPSNNTLDNQASFQAVNCTYQAGYDASQRLQLLRSPPSPQPKRSKKARKRPRPAGFLEIEIDNKVVMVREQDFFVNATRIRRVLVVQR